MSVALLGTSLVLSYVLGFYTFAFLELEVSGSGEGSFVTGAAAVLGALSAVAGLWLLGGGLGTDGGDKRTRWVRNGAGLFAVGVVLLALARYGLSALGS